LKGHAARVLGRALLFGLLAGGLVGLWNGGHYLGADLPGMLLYTVGRTLTACLPVVLHFALWYWALAQVLFSRNEEGRTALTATFLALPPTLMHVGFLANRAWGIRPSELFGGYGVGRNLLLVAGVMLLAGLWAALESQREELEPPKPPWRGLAATLAVWAGLALGVPFWLGQAAQPVPTPPVIVLVIDALRADEPSYAGNPRPTTPNLDAFRRDAVDFAQAIAPSTFTKSSIASLFTSRSAYEHGLYWGSREVDGVLRADLLSQAEVTLAELFREKGYLTTAWVQNSHLRSFMGFDQGFVDYHDQQGSIERIHGKLLPFLAGPGKRYGAFAYVHYIDLHDPYRPEPPYETMFGGSAQVYEGFDLDQWGRVLDDVRRGKVTLSAEQLASLRGLYAGQLRAIDEELGRLFARLKASGLYDRSVIVVTSDHGEAFGEHGFIAHSTTPYDELVRVPLLLKLPENRHAGATVREQVRSIDLAPTLLDLLGWKKRPSMSGCSLLPLLAGGTLAEECRTAVIEIAEEGAYPTVALRTERWKLIHREHGEELYDLVADPAERVNLLAQGELPPELAPLRERIAQVLEARKALERREVELDARQIQELRGLGYVK
jgi:arylsulfatase A-like enzyme